MYLYIYFSNVLIIKSWKFDVHVSRDRTRIIFDAVFRETIANTFLHNRRVLERRGEGIKFAWKNAAVCRCATRFLTLQLIRRLSFVPTSEWRSRVLLAKIYAPRCEIKGTSLA